MQKSSKPKNKCNRKWFLQSSSPVPPEYFHLLLQLGKCSWQHSPILQCSIIVRPAKPQNSHHQFLSRKYGNMVRKRVWFHLIRKSGSALLANKTAPTCLQLSWSQALNGVNQPQDLLVIGWKLLDFAILGNLQSRPCYPCWCMLGPNKDHLLDVTLESNYYWKESSRYRWTDS